MKPIAVFYHCKIRGEGIPSEKMSVEILCDQMRSLILGGLAGAAKEIHIGINGDWEDEILVAAVSPENAMIHLHGKESRSEYPTMNLLREFCMNHPGWNICYHHTKGVSHANDCYRRWRKCMENSVIVHWRDCVAKVENGFDTVGAHWFKNANQQYWAGNFWWAKSDYIASLPPINQWNLGGKSYESECWIGRSSNFIRHFDFAPHRFQAGCPNYG